MDNEMEQWLTNNSDHYEFYLLHAMMHDQNQRADLLNVPVIPDDFRQEPFALVIQALITAVKIADAVGISLESPPSLEFLRTYVKSVAAQEGVEDEDVTSAMMLIEKLQDPKYSENHYLIKIYFEAWYSTKHAKRIARVVLSMVLPDVRGASESIEEALTAASQFDNTLGGCEFDFNNLPEPPEPILKLGDNTLATPGNILNIQGPPKTAKSAVVGAIIASTMHKCWAPGDTLGLTTAQPAGRAILHFDTEQSAYHHASLMKRAYARASQHRAVSGLHSYCITGMEPAKCWDFFQLKVKKAAKEHSGIMMIIIDGIADFCNDPNNAEECFALIRKLHKLAGDYKCVVITVLHENPGNGSGFGKTRGHLGSQLERKAETSLRLAKDPKTEIVEMWTERARSCSIPRAAGFRFHWCNGKKMHVTLRNSDGIYAKTKPDKKAKYAIEVSKAFGEDNTLTFGELTSRLCERSSMAESTAKARIRDYLTFRLVVKTGDSKYQLATGLGKDITAPGGGAS